VEPRGNRVAFGAPGIEPRWSHSNKDGVGTAYSGDSRLWYTLWRGTVTEVYFHSIDQPHFRDLEFLLTDGETFFHEEKRHLTAETERPNEHALNYRVRSTAPEGRYALQKDILADPHLPCLLVRTRVEIRDPSLVGRLKLYALAAPHLEVGGWGNSATVFNVLGHPILGAEKGEVSLAIGCTIPFSRASVGYVGSSDGWSDLRDHGTMTYEFDRAPDGNVALFGEIPIQRSSEFTLGIAFGGTIQSAVTRLFQSLGTPFDVHHRRFVDQWNRTAHRGTPLESAAGDQGRLCRASRSILLAHEDKVFPGAFIASLSIPWGAARTDSDRGGYHLVWTRDLVKTAIALLAAGNAEGPLRALIYLATRQRPDGGFPQNFWVDGTPYWQGVQLDEVALPLLLARKLDLADALQQFDPYPMVLAAARYLIEQGPATQQDRWEEVGGYSPSTLATMIAGLTVAAQFAQKRGDAAVAEFVQRYSDFLECHVERWTVTRSGTLLPGVPRHYVRIRPIALDDPEPDEGPDLGRVTLPNLTTDVPNRFPAGDVVDAGFLDLVRYGIRPPDDPLIADSLRVVDHVLRVETPFGSAWRRYNHDGYGTRDDGGPYLEWGTGRAWPLLTGERGHYELARGHDARPFLSAMEQFATATGLLPEQVWDEPDRPALHLFLGHRTESAVPLVWAHAEYLTLLRSAIDRKVYDLVPEVSERYVRHRDRLRPLEVWKFNRRPRTVRSGEILRVLADQPFRLHASDDDWTTVRDEPSRESGLGLHYVDLPALDPSRSRWRFTFYWSEVDRWEGRDFAVELEKPESR
jgi:glucoamylase